MISRNGSVCNTPFLTNRIFPGNSTMNNRVVSPLAAVMKIGKSNPDAIGCLVKVGGAANNSEGSKQNNSAPMRVICVVKRAVANMVCSPNGDCRNRYGWFVGVKRLLRIPKVPEFARQYRREVCRSAGRNIVDKRLLIPTLRRFLIYRLASRRQGDSRKSLCRS